MGEPHRRILRLQNRARITYNEENIQRQYFAFPYPEMCYIRQNANGETQLKLRQTCKFFHKWNPKVIVENLYFKPSLLDILYRLNVHRQRINSSVIIRGNEEMEIIDVVTNAITCFSYDNRMMTNIRRCEAKEISLPPCELSMDELRFFTQSGFVKKWFASFTTIRGEDGNPICLEDFLSHLPGADIVRARVQDISHGSSSKIVTQNYNIKQLFIRFQGMMNVDELYNLLLKVLAPKAVVKVTFHDIEDRTYFATFRAEMNAKMKKWEPKFEKPDFRIVPNHAF